MATQQPHQTLRTGRPLDETGTPVGSALELKPGGRPGQLLRQSPYPLASSPGGETWAVLLARPDEGDTDRPVLLQWLGPDGTEPPPHIHPTTETFEALDGTLTLVEDGQTRDLEPGESVTIPSEAEHSFRNDTDEVVAFRAELPSMRTVHSLFTVWALDHKGAFGNDGEYGEPGPIHGVLLGEDLYDETQMTMAPLSVQRLLWATVGRLARAIGYSGIEERYLAPEFWEHHVEQPQW